MARLTHLDARGQASMVDVSTKQDSARTARAGVTVRMAPATLAAVIEGDVKKGDVLGTARIAGIMAAKNTAGLIPLCHPLAVSSVGVDFEYDMDNPAIHITASARTTGPTGVEMEAMVAASVAALTIYDMCKALEREIVIDGLHLLHKSGGKSGTYDAPGAT